MVFTPPGWVPELAVEPPDSVSLVNFMLEEQWGRRSKQTSYPPFVCGLTNKSFTAKEQAQRIEELARGLAEALKWQVNEGTELDKVLGVFTYNTVS